MSTVFLEAVRADAGDMVAAFKRRTLGAAITAGVLALAGSGSPRRLQSSRTVSQGPDFLSG